jgi:ABC-type phosphate/phosphonate transport system permease subunit
MDEAIQKRMVLGVVHAGVIGSNLRNTDFLPFYVFSSLLFSCNSTAV